MFAAELKSGIRNIELAVVNNARELGCTITGDSFLWNYGRADDRLPEIVSAQITTNAKTACLVLPREYCEDSDLAINRAEVREAILECVGFLAN